MINSSLAIVRKVVKKYNHGGNISTSNEKVSVVLFGMNGSGKGVVAKGLKHKGFKHVSCSGAIETIKTRYPDWQSEIDLAVGKGLYVPDHITIPVIDQIFVDFGDVVPYRLSIDGGVRTKNQGIRYYHYLRQAGHRIIAAFVDTPEKLCFERSMARMRADDTPDTIRTRFGQYRTYTIPAVEWARQQVGHWIGFITIPGDAPLEEKFRLLFRPLGCEVEASEIAQKVELEIAPKS